MNDLNNDIERYLSGKMSPAEMHALEKRALNDPFLADALEGVSDLSPGELDEDLHFVRASINKRIDSHESKSSAFWSWPLRIAAGLLVLISATVVIINLTEDQKSGDLALQTEAPEKEEAESRQFAPPVSTDSMMSNDIVAAPDAAAANKPDIMPLKVVPAPPTISKDVTRSREDVIEQTPKPAEEPVVALRDEAIAEEESAAATEAPQTRSESLSQPQSRRFNASAADKAEMKKETAESAKSSSAKAKIVERIVKGRVTAADGSELPGVNVGIKGTNIGTVTDLSGNYQIRLPQTDTTLTYSFIGYATAEVKANDETIDVKLDEDMTQLSEVVVVGYGQAKEDDDIASTIELASPQGGKKAFKQYLEKSLQYPQQALEKKTEGRVTVQFAVETTGFLSDFKVIKGIGNGCDEELIRLIRTGPKWNPTKKDSNALRDIVRVRMKFQLPKK